MILLNRINTKISKNDLIAEIRGFTLIELIVVVAIMLVVIGGGMAAFIKFNDRQNVLTAARELQTMLRSAQVKAKVGEDADYCRTQYPGPPARSLRGYQVVAVKNTSTATLQAVCAVGKFGAADAIKPETITFNSSVEFSDNINIEFFTLLGGVSGSGTIELVGNGNTYRFIVSEGGEISEGNFL